MQKLLFFAFLATFFSPKMAEAQNRWFTKSASVFFHAEGPMDDVEKIEAKHNTGNCVLDEATGAFEMAVTMKGFRFENALMEEHFNENYVESSKFPKASFKGKILNLAAIDFSKDGAYSAQVEGTMTLHGQAKPLTTWGQITIKNGKPAIAAEFVLLLSDFKIEIPALVKDKIKNDVKITINGSLEKLSK